MKSLLFALILASCAHTKEMYPTDTADERKWLQEYRDGNITWSEYQDALRHESENSP